MNVTLTMPDDWDPVEVPWDALLGVEMKMDGGEGTVTGVEVDAVNRVFTLSLA